MPATWPTLTDRSDLYTVTHTNWNELNGVAGALAWLHQYNGAIVSKSTQSVASGSFVKLAFDTETADPNSWFDNATNFRFTPTHAGKYHVSAAAYITGVNNAGFLAIYKNGSATGIYGSFAGAGADIAVNVDFDIVLNGSTDYVEIFLQHNHGSNRNVNGFLSVHFVGA